MGHLLILLTLASAASAAPQIVPYVHLEPEISPLALGIVRPGQAAPSYQQAASSYQQAAPSYQQAAPSYAPTGPVGYAAGAWTGGCYNNLGAGVPCRKRTLS